MFAIYCTTNPVFTEFFLTIGIITATVSCGYSKERSTAIAHAFKGPSRKHLENIANINDDYKQELCFGDKMQFQDSAQLQSWTDEFYCYVCKCVDHMTDCSRKGLSQAFDGIDKQTVLLTYANNAIDMIMDTNFKGLTQLIYLDLSNNKMMYIQENSFDDLVNLSCLFLHNNMIFAYTHLEPTNLFQNLINLRVLFLHANTPWTVLILKTNYGEYIQPLRKLEYFTCDGFRNILIKSSNASRNESSFYLTTNNKMYKKCKANHNIGFLSHGLEKKNNNNITLKAI